MLECLLASRLSHRRRTLAQAWGLTLANRWHLYSAAQYNTVQHSTVQYWTVQYTWHLRTPATRQRWCSLVGVSTVRCREARAGHSTRWCSVARHAALHGDTWHTSLGTRGTAGDLHSGTRHTRHVAAVARSGRGSPHSIQLPHSSATSAISGDK